MLLYAEQAVIGAAMKRRDSYDAAVAAGITAVSFVHPTNRRTWQATADLYADDRPVDAGLVAAKLATTGDYEATNDPGGILLGYEIGAALPSVLPGYIDVVRTAAARRQLEAAVKAGQEDLEAGADPDEVAGRLRAQLDNLGPAAADDRTSTWLPVPIGWADFWAKDRTAEDWLLEPFMPYGRMTAVWANRKAGKSLLSLEVAAALATGRPILGRRRALPIHVAYLDLEMTEDDLYERLEDMGYGADANLSHLHYYLLPSLPPLDTAAGGAAIEAIVVRDQAQVVVIDTMARVVKGEEDSSDTYRAFYQHTGLRLKMRGITALRLDHSGKDPTRDARGSSAKGDDIDLGWELKAADDGAVVLNRKLTRVSWVPNRVAMRRLSDPLRHVLAAGPVWPAGTRDAIDDLDRLSVPLTASASAASATLKEHQLGRRKEVVLAALKWRRQAAEDAISTPGTGPGTAPHGTPPEPLREPEGGEP